MKLTKAFFDDIRELIVSARTTIARGVDLVQVHTSFEIGRRIIEQEQKGKNRAAYGKEILKALSERLTDEFGSGFSRSNLEYMRKFFVLYQDRSAISQPITGKLENRTKKRSVKTQLTNSEKSQSMTGQFQISQSLTGKSESTAKTLPRPFTLSWTHYVFLLGIKNPDERSFYEIEAFSQGWTVRELKRQFDSSLYERLALTRDKGGILKLSQEGQIVANVRDLLKEPLVLEFLELNEQTRYSESDLEAAILSRIEQFCWNWGKAFCSKHDKSGSRSMASTFLSTSFFTIVCFAVTS